MGRAGLSVKKKDGGRYGLTRYFLLWVLFSFLGWAFETVVMLIEGYGFVNRGFLSFPVCPIYGTAIVFAYLLFGTLAEPKGVMKLFSSSALRYALYVLVVFLLPTVVEGLTGWAFDRWLGVSLWNYSHYPYNVGGYVCLPISIGWGIGLFLCLQILFPPFKKLIGKLPRAFCAVVAVVLGVLLGGEFVKNILQALRK